MQHLNFTCKIISPLVLNGAFNNDPELRPPAIKASLRYWWRAIHGHLSLIELKKNEDKIFGSTKNKSAFLIKILPPKREDIYTSTKLLPHKIGNGFEVNGIGKGVFFNIRFCLNNPLDHSNEDSQEIKFSISYLQKLFLLTTILGGLGKRSRRGFGAIMVTKIEDKPYENQVNVEKLFSIIESLVPGMYKFESGIISAHKVKNPQNKIEYPVIDKIEIAKNVKSLKEISCAAHDTKKSDPTNGRDYSNSLGSSEKPRLASPVYVSLLDGNFPIVTTLKKPGRYKVNEDLQNNFKERILKE